MVVTMSSRGKRFQISDQGSAGGAMCWRATNRPTQIATATSTSLIQSGTESSSESRGEDGIFWRAAETSQARLKAVDTAATMHRKPVHDGASIAEHGHGLGDGDEGRGGQRRDQERPETAGLEQQHPDRGRRRDDPDERMDEDRAAQRGREREIRLRVVSPARPTRRPTPPSTAPRGTRGRSPPGRTRRAGRRRRCRACPPAA